ncbi:MAG: IS200/IS605 family element transposase accessory protein TnpB [Syntrophaceae bacterium]|nr:IS200/IS605 family element transposase accessory protein TnpB [Syntrophaceae bacterium]
MGLNHAITEWHLYERERARHYRETKENLPAEERKKTWNRIYSEVRGLMKTASSGMASMVTRTAITRYQNSLKDIRSLKQSVPSYRLGHPILLREGGGETKLWRDNGNYMFRATLRNRSNEPTRLTFLLDTFKLEKSKKAVLDRVISGEYKLGACQVAQDRRKRWFTRIAYSFPRPELKKDTSICVGVDLGLACPFYCAVNNGHDRLSCNEALIVERFRWQIRRRRRAFQNSLKFSNRGGHGRNKALAPLEKLAEKEINFRDTKYHQYTSRIIEFALKQNAGVIQIEGLEGFRASQQGILRDWAIADFHSKLKYKAEHAGIEVREIDARYTSQRCSECGNINEANRQSQSDFLCTVCGYKTHADYNAARNISIVGIEKIIAEEIARKGLAEQEAQDVPQG